MRTISSKIPWRGHGRGLTVSEDETSETCWTFESHARHTGFRRGRSQVQKRITGWRGAICMRLQMRGCSRYESTEGCHFAAEMPAQRHDRDVVQVPLRQRRRAANRRRSASRRNLFFSRYAQLEARKLEKHNIVVPRSRASSARAVVQFAVIRVLCASLSLYVSRSSSRQSTRPPSALRRAGNLRLAGPQPDGEPLLLQCGKGCDPLLRICCPSITQRRSNSA